MRNAFTFSEYRSNTPYLTEPAPPIWPTKILLAPDPYLRAGWSWAPFISPSRWSKVESVRTIGMRTITGMLSFVINSILRESENFQTFRMPIKNNVFQKLLLDLRPRTNLKPNDLSPNRQTYNQIESLNVGITNPLS